MEDFEEAVEFHRGMAALFRLIGYESLAEGAEKIAEATKQTQKANNEQN